MDLLVGLLLLYPQTRKMGPEKLALPEWQKSFVERRHSFVEVLLEKVFAEMFLVDHIQRHFGVESTAAAFPMVVPVPDFEKMSGLAADVCPMFE